MRTHPAWKENWRALAPDDAVLVDVPRSREGLRRARGRIESLPRGTPVALRARSLGARRRCRRLARAAGVRVTGEYVPLPSAAAPAYLVEDAPGPWRYAWSAVVTNPPGSPVATAATSALLRVARHLARWRVLAAVIPGHLAVGRRR